MNYNLIKPKKKGFTLTELIVVIVIIGVLAAVLIPALTTFIEKAKVAANQTEAMEIKKVLDVAIAENQKYTVDLAGKNVEMQVDSYVFFETNDVKLFYETTTGKQLAKTADVRVEDNSLFYRNRGIWIKIDLDTLDMSLIEPSD